eukprot:scaffold3043_cov180-Amphora_coffeaeformis.AAC.30
MFSWLVSSTEDDSDSTEGVPDVVNPTSEHVDAAARNHNNPTTQTPSRRRTWNTAFRDACIEKGTFYATISQVLETSDGGIDADEIPTASKVVFWKQDGSKDFIVRRFREEINDSTNQNDTKKVQKSSIGSTLYKVAAASASLAKSATKVFWQSEGDLLMERYGVDEDDSEDENELADAAVDDCEPILNLELSVDCLHFLRDTILRYAQGDNEDILVLPRGSSSASAACQAWISRVLANDGVSGPSSVQKFVQKMALKDLHFLLEALVDCGVIKILQRQPKQEDLLIFLVGENSSSNELKLKLAMFDLTRQIEATQKRIDILVERKDKCTQSALHCRKTKQERQAMHHMKLRKTLEEEICKLQNIIHNLESQRLAVENAVDNGKILQVSKQTTDVLKNLRQESNEETKLDDQKPTTTIASVKPPTGDSKDDEHMEEAEPAMVLEGGH